MKLLEVNTDGRPSLVSKIADDEYAEVAKKSWRPLLARPAK
ncbi:hypothetical protein [Aurantivibrio plasticivorans]